MAELICIKMDFFFWVPYAKINIRFEFLVAYFIYLELLHNNLLKKIKKLQFRQFPIWLLGAILNYGKLLSMPGWHHKLLKSRGSQELPTTLISTNILFKGCFGHSTWPLYNEIDWNPKSGRYRFSRGWKMALMTLKKWKPIFFGLLVA